MLSQVLHEQCVTDNLIPVSVTENFFFLLSVWVKMHLKSENDCPNETES